MTESPIMYIDTKSQPCPASSICTHSIREGSNICLMDEGGPLYVLRCDNKMPQCLYGVADYFISDPNTPPYSVCNGGSFFTRITHYRAWIDRIVHAFP